MSETDKSSFHLDKNKLILCHHTNGFNMEDLGSTRVLYGNESWHHILIFLCFSIYQVSGFFQLADKCFFAIGLLDYEFFVVCQLNFLWILVNRIGIIVNEDGASLLRIRVTEDGAVMSLTVFPFIMVISSESYGQQSKG